MSTSYKGLDVLDIRPDFKTLDIGQLDDFSFDSQGLGRSTPWKPTSAVKRKVKYPFVLGGASDMKIWRVFVEEHRGGLLGFWMPLYVNDYSLTTDAAQGDTSLIIEKMGLAIKWALGNQFRHLAILNRAGDFSCHGIKAVTLSGETEILALDSATTFHVEQDKCVCCALIFARMQDEIEYTYKNEELIRFDVGFTELPTETLSPDFGSGPIGAVHTGSLPLYLYKFSRAGFAYRYTNWPLDLTTTDDVEWHAADISHGDIQAGLDFTAEGLEIQFATNDVNAPLRALLDRADLSPTDVEVFEADASMLEYEPTEPIYTGRVEEPSGEPGGVIRIPVSSVLRIAEDEGPRIKQQRLCVHRLYDDFCALSESAFTTSGTLSAFDSSTALPYVDATAFGAKATLQSDANWFALGKVTIGTQIRFCVGQSANRLYLNAPFRNLSAGAVVTAAAGCDKRIGTCETKFANVVNHIATTYMPNRNPQFEALETPKPAGGKKS